MENFNPNLDVSKFSENRKIDCNDLNEAFQIDAVKTEPCEINVFMECERYCNSYNNETIVDQDHNYAIQSRQELSEEKRDTKNLNPEDLDHSEYSESTNIDKDTEFKNEDCIDIFSEDIKFEIDEKPRKHFRFCEVCYQSFDFDRETDFFKSSSYRFECSCQKQNVSQFYNKSGQDMTLDVEPTSLGLTADSRLQRLEVQDDPISGDEVIRKQKFSAVSQLISKTLTKYGSIQCKYCSKFFSCESHLKIHEKIHKRDKPFRCKICSRSFSLQYHFTHHMKGHSGKKPFHCHICPKSFDYMPTLKAHERIHSGDKPFDCQICSKSFRQMCSLKVHQRIHTGEKPYHCKICSESFSYSSTLKTHEIHHIRYPDKIILLNKRIPTFEINENTSLKLDGISTQLI